MLEGDGPSTKTLTRISHCVLAQPFMLLISPAPLFFQYSRCDPLPWRWGDEVLRSKRENAVVKTDYCKSSSGGCFYM